MIEYTREFICLSSCLSFAKAARELNVSQPSLSRHIADLEKQLGFKLLERNPLSLTPAGKHYLESMSEIIGRIDAVVEQGRRIADGSSGSLTVCMVSFDIGVYSTVVHESIALMREAEPGFVAQFYSSRSFTVCETVLSGKADVGVVFDVPDDLPEGFVCQRLMDYPCMVWASKDNPVLKRNPQRIEDFAECVLIVSNNNLYNAWHDAEAAVMRSLGIEPRSRMRDVESVADCFLFMQPDEIKITSDMGITCPYNSNVVGVRFEDEPVTFPTYLLYQECSEGSTVARFVHTCSQVAERYLSETRSYSFAARS